MCAFLSYQGCVSGGQQQSECCYGGQHSHSCCPVGCHTGLKEHYSVSHFYPFHSEKYKKGSLIICCLFLMALFRLLRMAQVEA